MKRTVSNRTTEIDKEGLTGDLLAARGLKKTPIRMEMLSLFLDHDFALSAKDIIAQLKAGNDRVTIYRALAAFERNGILHRASEDGQGIKYALCGESCSAETHAEHHAHFVCDQCHKTYCLKHVTIPAVKISKDFSVVSAEYTLRGICKECRV